ncbi:HAD family hydrolase [Ascidiaceihabitans sp.]|uniref:HAD family hydrolase n=1 Tax=Ascidiaceihabitans sp. TaxID=1872644 RepID=UPI003298A776
MKNTPIKALIFDKDGTLFEFAATWEAWAQAMLLRLTSGDRVRAAQIGAQIGFDLDSRSFQNDSIVIAGTAGEIADVIAPLCPELSRDAVFELINDEAGAAPQIEAVPLGPFLRDLRSRGLKTGVATNDAEAPARKHLMAAGVVDHLDFIVGFDSGHGGKPAPGQLLAFCAATGCDPAHVVMVGDSTHDLRAGRAAGMRTIGVLTGMAGREILAPLADVIFPDIGHIPGWLDGPV